MGALKDRATVDRINPLTLLAAIDRHLAALRGAKMPRLVYARPTMRTMQAIRVKVLLDPFETACRIEQREHGKVHTSSILRSLHFS